MGKLKLLALTLLPLMTAACSNDDPNPVPDPPMVNHEPVPDGTLQDLTRASIGNINSFGVELLKKSLEARPENICMSPVSISSVLTMLANGDTGDSRDEILTVMGFEPGDKGLAELNFYNKTMLSWLPTLDPATTYNFTNSYWHDPSVIVRDDYKKRIADVMFASVFDQSPGGSDGMVAVNKFVEEHTNGLIPKLIQQPLGITSACLNTIYFKGEWSNPFEMEVTWDEDFANLDYSLSKVPFMHMAGVEYAEAEDGTRAVRLPYGNGSFYMTAVLPSDLINHVPLMECLDENILKELAESFTYQNRLLSLPKFECENNNDILDLLKETGIVKACDPAYGLDAITVPGPSFLELFLHATKLKVNEDGTEAAAASMGGMNESVVSLDPDPDLKPIKFDRPFIYMIQEKITGAIIFMGAVTGF